MIVRDYISVYTPHIIKIAYRKLWSKDIFVKRRYRKYLNQFYNYDMDRAQKYTNSYKRNDTQEKIIARILTVYHTIEKGLTMGGVRLGFGYEKMMTLVELCELYYSKYGKENEVFIEAIGVISEYNQVHRGKGYKLDDDLQKGINILLNEVSDYHTTEQPEYSINDYFKYVNGPFDMFSGSRHSLRDFKEGSQIQISILEKAVSLAINAPSTCNRQSIRLHLITHKGLLRDILLLQNGNKGFGERVDKLFIVTSELNCWEGPEERFGPFIDAGIFSMNLLYALHFYRIGAIALNWYSTIVNDQALRRIAGIPDSQSVALLIACGHLKDNFKIAKSMRRGYRSILSIHP